MSGSPRLRAALAGDAGRRWSATCPDFTKTGFRAREDAERWVERVEQLGACQQQHEIREEAS